MVSCALCLSHRYFVVRASHSILLWIVFFNLWERLHSWRLYLFSSKARVHFVMRSSNLRLMAQAKKCVFAAKGNIIERSNLLFVATASPWRLREAVFWRKYRADDYNQNSMSFGYIFANDLICRLCRSVSGCFFSLAITRKLGFSATHDVERAYQSTMRNL